MKIAICDDEQSCVDRICGLLCAYCTKQRLTYELSVFTAPIDFQQSGLKQFDVVFLDANMGEISGIEAARALREVNRTAVLVYISAFVEYAPMGYAVDAFRYLLKNDLDAVFADTMDEIVSQIALNAKKLLISTTNGEQALVIADITFLESFCHQILFHLVDGAVVESKQHTLKELSSLLAPHSFLRIHKSYLVNPEQIVRMKHKEVMLTNGQVLNCGKVYYSDTLKTFTLWKGGR